MAKKAKKKKGNVALVCGNCRWFVVIQTMTHFKGLNNEIGFCNYYRGGHYCKVMNCFHPECEQSRIIDG